MAAAPRPSGQKRFAILRARFNAPITQALADGAMRAFTDAGIDVAHVSVYDVPGAFELPIAALRLAESKRFHAIVALGCIIRGETPHFAYVADAAARGLQHVALDTGVPVAFGVLTTDTEAQAWSRAVAVSEPTRQHYAAAQSGTRGNKGYEAAQVAIEMARFKVSRSAKPDRYAAALSGTSRPSSRSRRSAHERTSARPGATWSRSEMK